MSFIRVRFVITGVCHNVYSGRQFQLVVPLTDGSRPTLVSGVLNRVRSQWPEEFSEMKEQVQTCPVKMLKTGELLSATVPFSQYLTQNDLATAVADASQLPNDGEKSPIIIHLVFQQPSAASTSAAAQDPERKNAGGDTSPSADSVRRDRTDDRPQNSGGCCLVM